MAFEPPSRVTRPLFIYRHGRTLPNNIIINANLAGTYGLKAYRYVPSGSATLTLGGDNGGLFGPVSLSTDVNLTSSTAGSANAAWTLNNGATLSYDPSVGGTGKTIQLGSLTGSGTLTNRGTAGPSDVTTFAIGPLGTNTTFSGSITDSAAGDQTAISMSGGSWPTSTGPTFTLTGSNTYTGPTFISGMTLQLEGTAGTLAGSTSITLSTSGIPANPLQGPIPGTLVIDNSASGNNNNRLSDSATISFQGGTFNYTGSGSSASRETIGAISLNGGYNTIAINASSYSATVNAASLARPAFGGVAVLNSDGLSLAAAPPLVGSGAITNGYTPTEHNAPIVPFLVGNLWPYTFMTYGRSGSLRMLDTSGEFTNNAIVPGDNTFISAATAASSSATINSLNVHAAPLTIGSGVTLNVASGAVLINADRYNAAIVGADPNSSVLSFNGGEAILGVFGDIQPFGTPTATISANLANLTGLTISGSWILNLTQGNATTDTAPVYIQSGGLSVSRDVDLGYASGPNAITFPVGSTGWLQLTGTAFSTSTKGISLLGKGTIDVYQATESASAGGVISGPGDLQKTGYGTLTLTNAANTYTGTTGIYGGTLALTAASNNNIPSSPLILVGSKSARTILDATQLTAPGGFQLRAGQMLAGYGTVKPPADGLVVGPGSVISGGDGVSATANLTTAGTQVWSGGGTYQWKINLSYAGTTGAFNNSKSGGPWDQLTMNALTVTATPANPFNIQVVGLTSPTLSNNFDPTKSYRWVAANMPVGQATGNLANTLAVNYAGFSSYNMPGSFSAAFDSTDDPGFTDLVISYSPTPEPSALALAGLSAGGLLLRRRRTRPQVG
jgi:fibronectin-binding autotransporter adhesin